MSDPEMPLDELRWTAFQYLAGELTADQAERFELDLAEDQPARDALAEAVQLWAAMSAALSLPALAKSPLVSTNGVHPPLPAAGLPEPFTVPTASGNVAPARRATAAWKLPAVWTGVGVAATLAAVLAVQSWLPGDGQRPTVDPASTKQLQPVADRLFASKLASAWLATREDIDGDATDDPTADISIDLLPADAGGDDLTAPDWLYTAVAHAQALHAPADAAIDIETVHP